MDKREEAPTRSVLVHRLGIVGLGLIGGSIAAAARQVFAELKIFGVDRDVIVDVARDQGLIDEGGPMDKMGETLAQCDVVVFCLPVRGLMEALDLLADPLRDGPVLTDTGSTKAAIVEVAQRQKLTRFVGGHPMAGKAQGGLAHADPRLFEGATWFLSPHEGSAPEAVRLVRALTAELGARPMEIDAAEHDLAVAMTSHLPHVLVNALAEAVLDDGALDAAGGSLRHLLTIAGAPVETWHDTLITNQAAVREGLLRFARHITTLADELEDKDRVRTLFSKGRACRERLNKQ